MNAAVTNATTWGRNMRAGGSFAPVHISNASGTRTSGNATRAGSRHRAARGLKAATNVSRYRPSGTTHSNGTAAMSVDRYVVTVVSRLDGTNASNTHLAR